MKTPCLESGSPGASWVSPCRMVSPRACLSAGYLDPSVISVLCLRTDGEFTACLPGQLLHGFHKAGVIPHPVGNWGGRRDSEPGPRERDDTEARATQTHRHTYTSRGGRVLGVMIQGATRNTTVSVKIGVSEKSFTGRPR